jgi:HAD superfamily hydrolase (TIGR01450 family)
MTMPRAFGAYAFDLDGTIYLGDDLLPGAAETIAELRERGARVVFVTNKPLSSAAEYAQKLTTLGIPASATDVVTAVDVLIAYLRAHHPGGRLLPVAETLVCEELSGAGFELTEEPLETDVVVVSFDRTFTYAKLLAAFRAIRENAAVIVATNPDPYCPTPEGGLPDCAAMLAAIEAATGARAEAIVGKPSAYMATAVLERLGVPAGQLAVVGDRVTTDVVLGQSVGAAGILVLTGATTADAAARSTITPDYVISSLRELSPATRGGVPT